MTGWIGAGADDRWKLEDEIGTRHLLLKVGTLYFELHGITVHVYRGPAAVTNNGWPLGAPEDFDTEHPERYPVQHVSTETRESVALESDDERVWAWLEGYAAQWTDDGR